MRLFKEFLNIVNSLVKILIYLHSNQLILNDIHPDNFIRDEHGKLHFIDLENSYLYGEKPFVGIESKISLKSWNFLDGKQADFHKLGNMLLFLLARLTVSEQSTVETDLLNRLLNSYGIDSNLSKFITYLLSGEVTKDGLVKWLESLDATSIDIDEVLPPKTDIKDSSISFIKKVERSCLEFDKYKKYLIDMAVTTPESEDAIIRLMNLERNLGLEGLSGVIVLVDNQGLKNIAEAGINILLNRFFKDVIADIPNKIIVSEEKFWKECARIFYSKEMWKHIKAKLIYGVVTMYASCLTNKVDLLSSKFRCMLMGIDNSEDKKQSAYELTQFALGNSLSYWYSEQILSQKDKKILKNW